MDDSVERIDMVVDNIPCGLKLLMPKILSYINLNQFFSQKNKNVLSGHKLTLRVLKKRKSKTHTNQFQVGSAPKSCVQLERVQVGWLISGSGT